MGFLRSFSPFHRSLKMTTESTVDGVSTKATEDESATDSGETRTPDIEVNTSYSASDVDPTAREQASAPVSLTATSSRLKSGESTSTLPLPARPVKLGAHEPIPNEVHSIKNSMSMPFAPAGTPTSPADASPQPESGGSTLPLSTRLEVSERSTNQPNSNIDTTFEPSNVIGTVAPPSSPTDLVTSANSSAEHRGRSLQDPALLEFLERKFASQAEVLSLIIQKLDTKQEEDRAWASQKVDEIKEHVSKDLSNLQRYLHQQFIKLDRTSESLLARMIVIENQHESLDKGQYDSKQAIRSQQKVIIRRLDQIEELLGDDSFSHCILPRVREAVKSSSQDIMAAFLLLATRVECAIEESDDESEPESKPPQKEESRGMKLERISEEELNHNAETESESKPVSTCARLLEVIWRRFKLRKQDRLAPMDSAPRDETTTPQKVDQGSMDFIGPWQPRSLRVEKENHHDHFPQPDKSETRCSYERDGVEVLDVVSRISDRARSV
ncbi:hypothetical protein DL98DRAFT_605351, partial [Cadophora sp. DSE1049]